MSPLDFFTDLFNPQLAFLPRALAVACLSAVVCAVVGTHVVLRGSAFITDAVSHAVFPGVAVAFLLGSNILIGGAVAGIISAVLITLLSHGRLLKEDSAIGIVFVAAFALGLLIMSSSPTYSGSLESFLFGSITGVDASALPMMVIASVVIVALVLAFSRAFSTVTIDRESARALGLPVLALDILLNVLVTLAIVLALSTVGNILVVALLVAPPATARLLTDSMPRMMVLAPVIGCVASFTGMWVSWTYDAPMGACIVLACAAIFVLVRLFAPRHGAVGSIMRERRNTRPQRTSGKPRVAAAAAGAAVLTIGVAGAYPGVTEAKADQAQPEREALRNIHVDATHLNWDSKRGLRMDVIVGQDAIRPADDLIIDVQQQEYEGHDVSKITLPENNALSFVGRPGETYWNAPQNLYDNWKPVWVGIGAGRLPNAKIDGTSLGISLLKVEGPSWVEAYQYGSMGIKRAFSSRDNNFKRFPVLNGLHGHFNWTFGKPGRYVMTFQGDGKNPGNGQPIKSNESKVVWQVGPDSASTPAPVGPESPRYNQAPDTPPTRPEEPSQPTTPTTDNPDTSQEPDHSSPESTEHSNSSDNSNTTDDSTSTDNSNNPPTSTSPRTTTPKPNACSGVIDSGHVDMAVYPKGDGFEAKLKDESQGAPVLRDPSSVVLHVNDSLKHTVPNGFSQIGKPGSTVWEIPQVQEPSGIWSGFNTENIDYSKLSGPVTISLASHSGPGRVVLYEEDFVLGLRLNWDTNRKPAGSFSLSGPQHVHKAWAFSAAGTHKVTVRYTAKTKSGKTVTADAPYTIKVGGTGCTPTGTKTGSAPAAPSFPTGADGSALPIGGPGSGTVGDAVAVPASASTSDGEATPGPISASSDVPADGDATSTIPADDSGTVGDVGTGPGDGAAAGDDPVGAPGSASNGNADVPAAEGPGPADAMPDVADADASGTVAGTSSSSGSASNGDSSSVQAYGGRSAHTSNDSTPTAQKVILWGAGGLFGLAAAAWAYGMYRDRRNFNG